MGKIEIDAVKLVRRIREKHYEETGGKSKAEQLRYYAEKAESLKRKGAERSSRK